MRNLSKLFANFYLGRIFVGKLKYCTVEVWGIICGNLVRFVAYFYGEEENSGVIYILFWILEVQVNISGKCFIQVEFVKTKTQFSLINF